MRSVFHSEAFLALKILISAEISYILRRVEEHGRECEPVDSPWSIRQTVVYHQINGRKDIQQSGKSIFLLVSLPSTEFEGELSKIIQNSTEVNPWIIHWLLVADSTRGWPEYIYWIESQLQDRVLYSCLTKEIITNETDSTNLRGHCWR